MIRRGDGGWSMGERLCRCGNVIAWSMTTNAPHERQSEAVGLKLSAQWKGFISCASAKLLLDGAQRVLDFTFLEFGIKVLYIFNG